MLKSLIGLLVISGIVVAPVTAAEAAVANGAVFNNPEGTAAQQNAIIDHVGGLVQRTPAGAEISIAMNKWDSAGLKDQVVAAHRRGVKVRVIVEEETTGQQAVKDLRAALGGDTSKSSWLVSCGRNRGCIGTRNLGSASSPNYPIMHNKFFLFSQTDGTSNVLVQTSANMNNSNRVNAWNNALTLANKGMYDAYRKYFTDLNYYRTRSGNNDYYWATNFGNPKAYFFPRHESGGTPGNDPDSDTIINVLGNVGSCTATTIRVVMWYISRDAIAQRLKQLAGAGCSVNLVWTDGDSVPNLGGVGRMKVTRCKYSFQGRDMHAHSKYMTIDGNYGGVRRKIVFTGSHNWSTSALRSNDEAMIKLEDAAIHDQYAGNFSTVWNRCRP